MFKTEQPFILIICVIGTLTIALSKLADPQMLYFNCALVLVVLLTLFIKKGISTEVFGTVSVIIILASLLDKSEGIRQQALFQQLLSSGIIIIASLIVLNTKRKYREIEKERTQMKALFEYAIEGVIVSNSKGEILMINPEALKLFGYSSKELVGKKLDVLIPEKYRSAYDQFTTSYFKNPSRLTMGRDKDFFLLRKSGEPFLVEVSLSFYQQDDQYYALAFINDSTLRKHAEKEMNSQKEQLHKVTQNMVDMNVELENKVAERTLILEEALQELERSQLDLNEALNKEKVLNEIKSRFVSMASHELRTPLSTVLSSASLISKYKVSDEQPRREKHVNRIKDSVKHLNDLLEDLLSLGKLEEGRTSTRIGRFNIHEFLKDVLDEMNNGLKHGQSLLLEFEGEPFFITDKRMLKNVLINLLSNAIKFSGEGKPIHVSVVHANSCIIIQVKDEGMGIAPEDLPHLFTTFYRGKNVDHIQGTGLGLHIVKRYIGMLNGKITLSTQLNAGTVINIGLPNLAEK